MVNGVEHGLMMSDVSRIDVLAGCKTLVCAKSNHHLFCLFLLYRIETQPSGGFGVL